MIADFPSSDVIAAEGRLALVGLAATLRTWFDQQFRTMALSEQATECQFPASIARETLTRAGYFESFPDGATPIGGGPRSDFCLTPAVCFHAYGLFAERVFHRPLRLTAAQPCFREADRRNAAESIARLWEFTMREIVFIGPAEWVAAEHRGWMDRTQALARQLELRWTIEPATDAFYGELSRGQRLIQQLKRLKEEMRLPLGERTIAAASFNLHETYFATRFDLRLPDGSPAHSGCAAFGLERWALALLAQRGEQAAHDLLKE